MLASVETHFSLCRVEPWHPRYFPCQLTKVLTMHAQIRLMTEISRHNKDGVVVPSQLKHRITANRLDAIRNKRHRLLVLSPSHSRRH